MSKNRKARHKKKTKEVVRDAVYRDKQEAQTASYSTRSSNRIITKKSKLNWVEKSLINSVGEPLIDRAPFIPVNQWFLLGQGLLGTAFFIKDGDWEGLWVILFIALSYLFLVTPIKYSVILGPYGRTYRMDPIDWACYFLFYVPLFSLSYLVIMAISINFILKLLVQFYIEVVGFFVIFSEPQTNYAVVFGG